MSNYFNETDFLQNIVFDSHNDSFLDIYQDIKLEAQLLTNNLLSNDYIGLINISSDFINLIKDNIIINYEINENKEDSDLEDNLNLELF